MLGNPPELGFLVDLQTLLLPFLPSVFPIGLSTRNGESTENMDDP